MEIIEAIKTRRSIRRFKNQKVEPAIIEEIIKAAAYAPSACNIQGWKFIIVDDDNLKNKIFDNGGSILIKKAPVGILVLYDNRTKNTEYHDDIQSASAAIQNIHLAALNYGLGTCWICHLPSQVRLRKILKIPRFLSPIAYILIGYPEFQPRDIIRKYKPEEMLNYNSFSEKWPVEKISSLKLLIKRILVKIYLLIPAFIKKGWLNKIIDENLVKKFDN